MYRQRAFAEFDAEYNKHVANGATEQEAENAVVDYVIEWAESDRTGWMLPLINAWFRERRAKKREDNERADGKRADEQ